MKLYSSGLMAVIITATSLLAIAQTNDSFYLTHNLLFWVGQCLFIFSYIVMAIVTIRGWKESVGFTKKHFIRSLFVAVMIYSIAWTGSSFSWLLILVCGTLEAYFTRKRAGLIKQNRDH